MFRTVKLVLGLLKLACILLALYILFLVNIVGGGGPILLAIAIFFVVKFIAATKKVG
jgi:hypothetical protein